MTVLNIFKNAGSLLEADWSLKGDSFQNYDQDKEGQSHTQQDRNNAELAASAGWVELIKEASNADTLSLLSSLSVNNSDPVTSSVLNAESAESLNNLMGGMLAFNIHGSASTGNAPLSRSSTNEIESTFNGTISDDEIFGLIGDDMIYGNEGNDVLFGIEGNDMVVGGAGDDIVDGGAGNDFVNGGPGDDILFGGDGDDILESFEGNDIFFGGDGDDTYRYRAGAGMDVILDTSGDDTLEVFDLTLDDLTFTRMDNNLIINTDGINENTITILGHFPQNGDGNIETLVFEDGTVFNLSDPFAPMDDTIFGTDGDDRLEGTADDDTIDGLDGSDILIGGGGGDTLIGGGGDDMLFGDNEVITQDKTFSTENVTFPSLRETINIRNLDPPGDNALGIAAGDLSVEYETQATVTFVQTNAGFNNTLGFYNVNADGSIQNTMIAFENVKDFDAGDEAMIELPGSPDTDFGFFIIANGQRANQDYRDIDFDNGNLEFFFGFGTADQRAATVNDDASDISLVFTDANGQKVLSGEIYHSTERGGSTNLNPDGEVHVVSGLVDGQGDESIRIGFEDLPNTGDADYNDVVFDLTIDSQTTIVGEEVTGDDVIILGEGADQAWGGAGADQFIFDAIDAAADIIHDFEAGVGGDILNFADVLEGHDPINDDIANFLQVTEVGGNAEISVNVDGDVGGEFTTAVVIQGGVNGASVQDLITDGNLVAEQSVL